MRVVLLIVLFAFLGLTSGCQTNSASSDPYARAVMDDFQKTRQKHDAMFAEMRKEIQARNDEHNKRNAPFYAAMAEYERWYNSLSTSEKCAVDSALEQKMIHRRIMQGPNGVGVYDHCYDEQEVMAEYKKIFGH